MQGHQKRTPKHTKKEHHESRYTVYFDFRVQDHSRSSSNMMVKIYIYIYIYIIIVKERSDLSLDKVHCCYFDEGNLQAIDVKEELN